MRRSARWTCRTPATRTCRTLSSCGGAHGRARARERSRRVGRVLGRALEALAAQRGHAHRPPRPALPRARWSCYPAERAAPAHRYSALWRGSSGRRPSGPPRAAIGNHTSPHRTTFGVGWPAGFLVGCAESWRLSALRCRRRRVEVWGRTDTGIPRATSTPHPSIQPRPAQMAVTRYQPTGGCPQGYADWCLAREIV